MTSRDMTSRALTFILFSTALCARAASAPSAYVLGPESLNFTLAWPSGISLGEAHLTAARDGANWNFELRVSAALPWYAIDDTYRSVTTGDLCTASFERITTHGSRKASETITVGKGTARRTTAAGGGSTELSVSSCPHDPLALLYTARREIAQGRVPTPETVLFGPGYSVRFVYGGADARPADKITCMLKPSKGEEYAIDLLLARDAARTPLHMQAPFAIGVFSVELAH